MSGTEPDPTDIRMKEVVPTLKELRLYWESEKWEFHYRTTEAYQRYLVSTE